MNAAGIPGQVLHSGTTSTGIPHEGLRAGLLAATVVWLWLFVVDALSGTPLRTHTFFGWAILTIDGTTPVPTWAKVLTFTIFLALVWMLVGGFVASMVRRAPGQPTLLIFVAFIFTLLQLASVAAATALANLGLGRAAWTDFFVGELLGWATTLWYISRHHPEMRTELLDMEEH
ncbi:MAG TPA: hypothetical protein VFS05_07725 [Gemmatimonadaceae bacterium]|nr:hypothetical protein [Gemmatimonadaceae bacterium]